MPLGLNLQGCPPRGARMRCFTCITAHLCCRWPVASGLIYRSCRQWRRSQPCDQRQNVGERLSRHGNLGQTTATTINIARDGQRLIADLAAKGRPPGDATEQASRSGRLQSTESARTDWLGEQASNHRSLNGDVRSAVRHFIRHSPDPGPRLDVIFRPGGSAATKFDRSQPADSQNGETLGLTRPELGGLSSSRRISAVVAC